MMKKTLLAIIVITNVSIVGLPFLTAGQEQLNLQTSCSYYGEQIRDDLYGFTSDAEAETVVKRIMKYTGLPPNFTTVAANVPNAAAAIQGEIRYLLYNQEFMLRMKDLTHNDWPALSIMAHEIGHHLSGHTLTADGSRPPTELEADKFSGFVLYKMGASRQEARVVMKNVASDRGSATHPPKSARLAAITNGWIEARDQGGTPAPPRPDPTPAPTHAPDYRLRSTPKTVSPDDAQREFGLTTRKFDWGTSEWAPRLYVDNQYEDRGNVVVDHATGLMWQKSGSDNYITYADAQAYVAQLNSMHFAGYND